MAAANVLERGDRVLVVSTGYFGDHLGEWYENFHLVATIA